MGGSGRVDLLQKADAQMSVADEPTTNSAKRASQIAQPDRTPRIRQAFGRERPRASRSNQSPGSGKKSNLCRGPQCRIRLRTVGVASQELAHVGLRLALRELGREGRALACDLGGNRVRREQALRSTCQGSADGSKDKDGVRVRVDPSLPSVRFATNLGSSTIFVLLVAVER